MRVKGELKLHLYFEFWFQKIAANPILETSSLAEHEFLSRSPVTGPNVLKFYVILFKAMDRNFVWVEVS